MVLNWDGKLVEWAEELRAQEFLWGAVDCLTAALEASAIVAGKKYIDIGTWDSRETFVAAVGAAGGPEALLSRYFRRIGITRLQTGDLVWTPDGCTATELGSIVVVIRDKQLLISETDGVQLLPLNFPVGATAWRLNAR